MKTIELGMKKMIPNWIEQRTSLTPHRVALTFQDEKWTYEQLSEQSKYYAGAIKAAGLHEGQRVAIFGRSTPHLIRTIFACMQLRIEMVLLNLRLTEAELAYQIQDAQVDALLVDDDLVEQLPSTHKLQILFSDLMTSQEKAEVIKHWSRDETMTIMYTSGTTSQPKGVRQTIGNHMASATSALYNTGLVEDEGWICTVPIFHISGFSMLCKCILHGVRLDLYEKYTVEEVALQLIEGTATRMSAVAVMLEKLVSYIEEQGQRVSPKFQLLLVGGGPVPKSYLTRAEAIDLRVAQTYGMTETASQVATLSSKDALRKVGSVGKPLMFNEICIAGAERPFDHGEICVRGDSVTPGYVGQHAHIKTQVDGFLHTGDIGYFDDEGYLYVADRRSDLIISGGENIYPAEIENVLAGHPLIAAVGVCGVQDEIWGQVPAAFIMSKETTLNAETILAFCEDKLAKYKLPKQIHFVEELPRNGTGKLLRRKLVELIPK